jgi:hypothetical protein
MILFEKANRLLATLLDPAPSEFIKGWPHVLSLPVGWRRANVRCAYHQITKRGMINIFSRGLNHCLSMNHGILDSISSTGTIITLKLCLSCHEATFKLK